MFDIFLGDLQRLVRCEYCGDVPRNTGILLYSSRIIQNRKGAQSHQSERATGSAGVEDPIIS